MVEHSHIFSLRVDDNFAKELHVGEPNRRSEVTENMPKGLYRQLLLPRSTQNEESLQDFVDPENATENGNPNLRWHEAKGNDQVAHLICEFVQLLAARVIEIAPQNLINHFLDFHGRGDTYFQRNGRTCG